MQLLQQKGIHKGQKERQREIHDVLQAYIAMYAARDERLITRLSHSFTGFTGSSGQLVQSRDEWLRLLHQEAAPPADPIQLELHDVALQDLCEQVVSVAATLRIASTDHAAASATHITRLVLVCRLEAQGWMITHCSHSMPLVRAMEGHNSLALRSESVQAALNERIHELQKSQAFYRLLTEDTDDVHWQMDRHLIITYINPADERMRGFKAEEVIGHSVYELLPDEAARQLQGKITLNAPNGLPDAPSDFHKFEVQLRCKDGSWVWGEVMVKAEHNAEGEVVGYHGITRNATERKRLEEQVHQLAFQDTLTNLANRRLLLEHIKQAMNESKRSHYHGALVYLDLDNFKPLNDTHGHAVGDLLLIEVGVRLTSCVRTADTVARIGGDEFVVLLRALSQHKDEARAHAMAVAEKIRAKLGEPYWLRASPTDPLIGHRCTCSVGVALFQGCAETVDSLMERGDQAMYQAKEQGRNCVRLSDPHTASGSEQPGIAAE